MSVCEGDLQLLRIPIYSVSRWLRWGRKCLHHFAANVFSKRCTKFYQNRQILQ